MFTRIVVVTSITCVLFIASDLDAGTVVQTGTVSGGTGPTTQDVLINQFDDLGGTLLLTKVQLDFLTSVIGGFTADGSGIPVQIFAQLDAEWSLDGNLLADTQALINTGIPNTNTNSATVFNTDTETVNINNPGALAAWTGNGTIALSVFTDFEVFENPAGIIGFGAGGTVRYTVTYDYVPVPAPGAAAILGVYALSPRSRRRR